MLESDRRSIIFHMAPEDRDIHYMLLKEVVGLVGQSLPNALLNFTNIFLIILYKENMSAVDALYAVFNITGRDATWPVTKTESHACGGHEASRVHVDEMVREIREIFQVDEDTMEQLKNEALQRKILSVSTANRITLNPSPVKEARIHKVKESTVYISVTTPSKHDNQDLMTSFIKSFAPKWDHEFSVPIRDHRKDHIYLQLWQNGEDELTWLIEPELATIYYPRVVPIATLSIPIMEVIETELNGWYEFESTVDTDIPNLDIESVKVHLSGHITCSSDLSEQHQSYDEFLLSLFKYHTSVSMDPSSELWQGTLPASLTALSTHSRILHNIRKNTQLISWCKASVQLPNVDAVHTLSLVKNIQTKIVESSYSKEDLDLLEDTLILIMEKYEERIRSLDSTFPFSNSDSERQLTAVLKTLGDIHRHPKTQMLIYQSEQPLIHERVTDALITFGCNWLKEMDNSTLLLASSPVEQIRAALVMTKEVLLFLGDPLTFYNNIFLKEMKVNCYKQVYQSLVKEMVSSLEPVLTHICKRLLQEPDTGENAEEMSYDFGLGSNLLKVYTNLCQISFLGRRSESATQEIGIEAHHQWFIPAVHHWLAYTNKVALQCVENAVEKDSFERMSAHCHFSTSATDTASLFYNVKVWWHKIAWDDQITNDLIPIRILEDQCNVAKHYCHLLFNGIDSALEQIEGRLWIGTKVPVVVANMEYINREVGKLPMTFGLDSLKNGNDSTVKNLIENVQDTISVWINQYLEAILRKVKPTIKSSLNSACESGDVSDLLNTLLDPALSVLYNDLPRPHFLSFLANLWDCVVLLFLLKLEDDIKMRKNSYFKQMRFVLNEIFHCFTPSSDSGLNLARAKTPGYMSLVQELDLLKLDSNELIRQYYQDRWMAQQDQQHETTATLVIRAHFSENGSLNVTVIMADDKAVAEENNKITISTLPLYHVKLELIPEDWSLRKNEKTQALKDIPATFDEDFVFENLEDNDIENGFLVLRFLEQHVIHSNILIGEAVIPLSHIQKNSDDVKNMYLHLDTPCLDSITRSLQILNYRRKETTVYDFLKKLEKRYPETKKHFRKLQT
ncbi:protein unc-13 homolog 4B-like [Penaeus japonicus]|uniref:protein unc-13 homolog 4B-like n=1 Tax=Penaeus japonicus TaxID=27405 RepID=UPI001C712F72|nr:protein unc-13 homolog 4B-like [Penaeus japonicus]